VPVTIGIGNNSAQLCRVSDSYKEAVNSLGYKAIVVSGSTIYLHDLEPVIRGELELDGSTEDQLGAAIISGTNESIEASVAHILERMNDAGVHFVHQTAYMLSVVYSMIQLLQLYDLDMRAVFIGEFKEYGSREMLPVLHNIDDLSIWL
jgi:hypothetical protein